MNIKEAVVWLKVLQIFAIVGIFLFSSVANEALAGQKDDDSDIAEIEDVYSGPEIVINVAARQMHVYLEDEYVKSYPIAVGSRRFRTPLGPRTMHQVVLNAWWIPPKSEWAKNSKPSPPGKNNPLGSLKMRLGGAIMAHGTNKPKTIGKAASHGCIRMFTEDAQELAYWIVENVAFDDIDKFDKAELNKRRSVYINLTEKVPVDVIYDFVEVKDKTLFVYRDVYSLIPNKIEKITEELELSGIDMEDVDFDFIKEELKTAKNKEDLSFTFREISISERKKVEEMEMEQAESSEPVQMASN